MAEKKPRSVSQINQWKRCPQSWYLSRIEKVWQRPAAWLSQGTALHAVAENAKLAEFKETPMDREEAHKLFSHEYADDIAKYTEITPNLEYWSRSGPYGGAADIERRYGLGHEQVDRLYNWWEKHPEEAIWIAPDGKPGIELDFQIDLDGVPVRGYIDAIIVVDGQLVVRDYKSGNKPGDDFQLGVYSVAVAETYDVEAPATGDYWMGKSGKPTYPFNLTDWNRSAVTEAFHQLEEDIQAERFDALPEPDKCKFCDVSYSCSYRAD